VAELAYEAGEVELTEIAANTVLRYAKNPPENSTVVASNSLQYAWVGLNTEHPKLKDPRVRKAIQHAVDVKSILQGAYNGVTHPSYGPVPPGLVGKRSETNYAYDPAKAKALLSEAGVSGLELSLRTMNAQDRMLAAQIVQANLLAVGIKLEIIPLEAGPFWDMGQESKGDVWKDLELWIMRYGTSPDPYSVMQWFVRSQVGIWNWERWSSDEFEDLYAKGLVETDVDARHSIYIRMQEIMEDTGGYVWLTHEPESFVHSNDLVPEIGPSGNLDFRNFKRV
jgi:peptide/nickel transport system substrate-binding protein